MSAAVDLIGNRTLRDLLGERAHRYPDKPCLVVEDATGDVREYTYAAFVDLVRRAAAGFSV